MPFTLTEKDRALLAGVHPDLQKVILHAARKAPFRFRITEGVRSLSRQRQLVEKGASKTMNSRHLTGHAVDLVPYIDYDEDGDVDADDLYAWPLYYQLAPIIKEAAKAEGVPVEWGGDWKTFKDGPHWQLPWKQYPSSIPKPKTPPTDREIAAVTTTGTGISAAVLADPAKAVVDAMTGQQLALSSGDLSKIIVAAVIVLLTGFYVWARKK